MVSRVGTTSIHKVANYERKKENDNNIRKNYYFGY